MKTLIEAMYDKKDSRNVNKLARLWEEANGCPMTWDSITKINLHNWVERLKQEVAHNSVRHYCEILRAVLNLYSDEFKFPKGYADILSLPLEGTISTWVNEDEIERIMKYRPITHIEEVVKHQFLLGCLTGARHVDFQKFTLSNIVGENIVYIAQKTKQRVEVPLSPAVRRILRHYDVAETIAETTFAKTLRKICRESDVDEIVQTYRGGQERTDEKWKFVSAHTARRSFATNLYLRCRDIFLVSKYMGHAKVDMTVKYILSIGDAPMKIKSYFERFK